MIGGGKKHYVIGSNPITKKHHLAATVENEKNEKNGRVWLRM